MNRQEKVCGKCKQVKPLSEFYRNRCMGDGLQSFCKACEYVHKRTDKGKAEQRRAEENRTYNPAQNSAHSKVYLAVKAGKMPHIKTRKCAECDEQADNYHHHSGYEEAHRLDVVPLCGTCHRAAHSQ